MFYGREASDMDDVLWLLQAGRLPGCHSPPPRPSVSAPTALDVGQAALIAILGLGSSALDFF
jgi:hypothetical protein